ncbi:MAG: hypothetical protein M1823_006116 [Watsoniomyces obsoletus]|nr:MAG: hypothetical protein M1823_006116 [Watsoniomyces obsoletus]
MSTSNPPYGTKVKTDPAGQRNIIQEGAGPVTSDSLAAESTRSGGGFAANRDAQPLSVKGANSTFNTTDTSAARELPPAAHGADRPDRDDVLLQTGSGAQRQGGHEGSGSGPGSQQHSGSSQVQQATSGTATGSDSSPQSHNRRSEGHGEHATSGSGPGGSSGHHDQHHSKGHGSSGHDSKHEHEHANKKQPGWTVGSPLAPQDTGVGRRLKKGDLDDEMSHEPDVAPTYVSTDVTNRATHQKPKGKNLKEGDIPDDAPNASFTAEIGSKDDPGRLAEQKMGLHTAESALDAGHGPRQKKIQAEGQYDALNPDEPA